MSVHQQQQSCIGLMLSICIWLRGLGASGDTAKWASGCKVDQWISASWSVSMCFPAEVDHWPGTHCPIDAHKLSAVLYGGGCGGMSSIRSQGRSMEMKKKKREKIGSSGRSSQGQYFVYWASIYLTVRRGSSFAAVNVRRRQHKRASASLSFSLSLMSADATGN